MWFTNMIRRITEGRKTGRGEIVGIASAKDQNARLPVVMRLGISLEWTKSYLVFCKTDKY